jgi:hypothetical protein
MTKESKSAPRRPWHLWLVGILSILWNTIACLDFTMVQTRNADYLETAGFSAEQMDFFYSYPVWANAVWGIAVWSAMLGGFLLLARKRLAVPIYLIGLIAYVGAMVRQYGFTEFNALFPEAHYLMMSVIIFVLAVAQLNYAQRMAAKGVLA